MVDNIINREFTQTKPEKAWVSDITYIAVKEGFIYSKLEERMAIHIEYFYFIILVYFFIIF